MYESGQVLGAYRVVRVIGEGGAAVVCEVVEEATTETYALKVLGLRTKQLIGRIEREAKILSRLVHPNILKIHELVQVDGRPAIRMEYVDGEPLDTWLQSHPDPDLDTALRVFDGILAGMRYAHDQQIIHRDLKPANVLLSKTNEVKIADFGIAKQNAGENTLELTRPEMALGTPAYTAPEQVQDARKVDHRADIFSMGCILFELVCGRQAFPQRNLMERIMAQADGEYPDPDSLIPGLDPPIVWAIHGSLHAEPGKRIGDCATFRAVLDGEREFTVEGRSLQPTPEELAENEMTVIMMRSPPEPSPPDLPVQEPVQLPARRSFMPLFIAGLAFLIGIGAISFAGVAIAIVAFVATRLF